MSVLHLMRAASFQRETGLAGSRHIRERTAFRDVLKFLEARIASPSTQSRPLRRLPDCLPTMPLSSPLGSVHDVHASQPFKRNSCDFPSSCARSRIASLSAGLNPAGAAARNFPSHPAQAHTPDRYHYHRPTTPRLVQVLTRRAAQT